MEDSTITYSVSSCGDSLLEASKEFVIKLLVEDSGVATIRRIRLFRIVDSAGKISYDKLTRYVSAKIRYSVSDDIRLSYLDVDDDCVVVDSNEELMDAIDQFSDQRVLRLFVGEVTPKMRKLYIGEGGGGGGAGGKGMQGKKLIAPEDIEQIIERQIEQVLEKRFRLLEQRRREQVVQGQQGGGRDPVAAMSFPHLRHLQQQYNLHQQLQQQARQRCTPSHQQQPRSPNKHDHHHHHNMQSPRTPRNQETFHEEGGWYDSPIKVDYLDDDDDDEMIGEEDFLPNEDSNTPRSVTRVRLPWESPDDDQQQQPNRPSSDHKPSSRDNNNNNNHGYRSRHSTGGAFNPTSYHGIEEYDLTQMSNRSLLHQHRLTVARRARVDSPTMEEVVNSPTKRIHISRDPVQTLNTRYMADPKAELPNYRPYNNHSIASSGPPTPIRAIEDLNDHRDDDDFRPEDPDPDDGVRDDDTDAADTFDTGGESLRDDSQLKRTEDGYLQDWENNTIDSDAELSLLLSDTDFREVNDDMTSKGPITVASSSQLSSLASEMMERANQSSVGGGGGSETTVDRQDENRRHGLEPPTPSHHHKQQQKLFGPPSALHLPQPKQQQQQQQQQQHHHASPSPMQSPRQKQQQQSLHVSPRPLQAPHHKQQQQQQQQHLRVSPSASPSTPTKTNVRNSKLKIMASTTPKSNNNSSTTPKKLNATTPKSNLKPPSPVTKSNFNNIPRPTPPASTKKNKLLGILYN